MKRHQFTLTYVFLFFLLFLSACGGNGDESANGKGQDQTEIPPTTQTEQPEEGKTEPGTTEKAPDPVSLNFFYNGFSESLTDQVKAMVENKFSHVTINMILHGTGQTINDVLAAGTDVDLAAFTMGQLFNVMDLQLATDMTELIKKHQFDLNRLTEGVMETVQDYSEHGEFLVMPYELNNSVLLYNKNIFDKFGVPLPEDELTWDDVLDIVRQVSREEEGITYRGFAYSGANPVYKNQLGLSFVDPVTETATLHNDQWQRWLQVMTSFYQVKNNEWPTASADNMFFKDMIMALRTGPNPLDLLPPAIENGLEWDASSMPTFHADESSGSQMNAPFYIIPPRSRDKDEAFKVIAYLMSDEVQSWNAKQGRVPIVKSQSVIDNFGADIPFLAGTNYANAVFNEKIAEPIRVTKYDGIVRTELAKTLISVAHNGVDVNTALRQAEELSNKAIEEAKK